MANFNLLQTPNFAQAALGGYEAGRRIGFQRRRDAALSTLATRPDDPDAFNELAVSDPGAARDFSALQKDRESTRRANTTRQTLAELMLSRNMGSLRAALGQADYGSPSGQPSAQALTGRVATPSAAGPVAPALGQPQMEAPTDLLPPGSDIVVNGPQAGQGDARTRMIRNDPEAYLKYQAMMSKVTKGELDTYQAVNSASLQLMGGVSDQASYDAARRQAAELHDRYGVGVDGFDLPAEYNPQVVERLMHQALTVKDQLAVVRAERKQAWDIEDDTIDNERADRNLDSTIEDRGARRGLVARGQDLTDRRGRRGQDIASGDRRRGQDLTDTRVRERPAGSGRIKPAAAAPAPASRVAVDANGVRYGVKGGKWVPIK